MPEAEERARVAHAVREAFGSGATIVAMEPLYGDASSRRYVRLRLRGPAPASVVVMLLGEGRFTGGSDELGGGAPLTELPFVNVARYLTAHGLPVPAIHGDRSREDGLLLVEDVGDTSLWAAVSAAPARAPALFADAVDLLVRLQLVGERTPDVGCVAFHRRFDAELARAELAHYVDHGVETRHAMQLDPADRRAVLDALDPLVSPFAGGPFTLSHRDYMAWNIHVRDGGLVLLDFQDALLAPDAFDLAQLLTDRTTGTIVDAALESELVARFEAARAAAGRAPAPGFVDRYRRCALQHVFKVIGRFYFLEVVKRRPGYLAYLPAVYAVGRRLLDALPDLAPARRRVVHWTPELA